MGRIAAPYGVKGWLKVLPLTADSDALLSYRDWWLRRRGDDDAGWHKCTLESGKPHGKTLLVQLAGLVDREAAAVFAGGEVGVARSALPAAGANEVYALAGDIDLLVHGSADSTDAMSDTRDEIAALPTVADVRTYSVLAAY